MVLHFSFLTVQQIFLPIVRNKKTQCKTPKQIVIRYRHAIRDKLLSFKNISLCNCENLLKNDEPINERDSKTCSIVFELF